MKHALRFPEVTPRRLKVIFAVAAFVIIAALLWFVVDSALNGQEAETNGQQRDAAVVAAEGVIDCVQDPTTDTTEDCEAEAQEAQETLEKEVPPATLSKGQRSEVILIAAELIDAQPEISEAAVVAEVLALLPDVDDGDRGRRGPAGPAGADGESPSTAEVRALVEAVYAADPPAPGDDGTNGTDGSTGPQGPQGPKGEKGDRGETGSQGATGDQGPAGPAGPTGGQGLQGPAGPTCPDGYAGRNLDVLTPGDGPLAQPVVVTIFACVPAPAPAE